jgi:hypothetical protein
VTFFWERIDMACCLVPSTTAREDFVGQSGDEVTIDLQAPKSAEAMIIHVRYGDHADGTSPFQFTLRKKTVMLVVLVQASHPGAELRLIEKCGDTTQVLDRFHFDPRNPARGYFITGK